ncbi:MAG: hypothetical protein RR444_03630 [Oscillospiraceae bacterium]
MKKKPIIFLVMTVLVGLYVFFASPNLNPLYADGAFFWLVLVSAYLLVATVTSFSVSQFIDSNGRAVAKFDKSRLPKKWVLITLGILWAAFFLMQFIFTPLLFSSSYKNQMKDPEIKEFTSEVQAVDINQIPIVDKNLAATLADKKLGEKPSLGSQVVLGEPTMQNVNGELVWVVPLQHSGFFKWLANIEGSAGYIKVSATNLKNVEYVEDYKIKIQPYSYLMHDLTRKVRFSGGLFDGITDYSFELNDEGKPYWVVTTYKNTCGFNLPEADGVIMVDAQSGDTQKYTIADVPTWVDRVQPEDFIINQINNKGQYIHGVFNFSNKEKYKVSQGDNIIYNDGRCYLFTGITSVGSDDSATGFYMVDMVTKEPILYRMSGATERSAQQSAQGKVQDLGYVATAPILLNVFDEPTYFMTLKDSARLIKKYAFVSVKDYMIVGVGDTMKDAQADYAKVMKDISDKPIFGETEKEKEHLTVTGIIDRINFTVNGEDTFYSFTLGSVPNKIFTANLSTSNKLPLTQKGDNVTIKYYENVGNLIVSEFNNQTF